MSADERTAATEKTGTFLVTHAEADSAREIGKAHITGQLANVLFGDGHGQPALNRVDPTVQKALSLWSSSRKLAEYHTAERERGDE